jgi:hypothetical protein
MNIADLKLGDTVWACHLDGEVFSGMVTLISDKQDYVVLDNSMNKIVTEPHPSKEMALMSAIKKLTDLSDSYRRSINIMTGKMHQCNKAIRELFKKLNVE